MAVQDLKYFVFCKGIVAIIWSALKVRNKVKLLCHTIQECHEHDPHQFKLLMHSKTIGRRVRNHKSSIYESYFEISMSYCSSRFDGLD